MEWPSLIVIKVLIVTSLGIFFSETCTTTSESMTLNYVTPSKATPCLNERRPCLTLKEYASQPDIYFVNNTVLCFHPGTHELGDSLRLKNVYNFSFEGLPTVVNVEFYSSASITWEKSWNINISSITFILRDNFTFIIRFELSLFVHLSNISIVGNGYSGCSSIISRESTLDITDSMFNRVKGLFGAALMMLASNITFSGTNNFVNNTAISGGSVYLSDSNLTLNGANLFLNNTSLRDDQKDTTVINRSVCDYSMETTDIGSGGAIYCSASYLRVYGHSIFTGNVAEFFGGAINMESGHFTFQGNISFSWNRAIPYGGSIYCWNSDGQFIGTAYFNENYDSAIISDSSNITFVGTSYFYGNTGSSGGAIQSSDSNIMFSGTAYFERNVADIGGAMLLGETSKLILKPKLNISFILNHANDSGGALYFRDSQCSLGTTKLDCFIIIDGPLASISNVSLHFVNNSAGSTGSVLYGGQFDKCRLLFKSNYSNPNISASNTHNTYSDAALQVLIAMSTIVEHAHNESANISSYAEKVWVCSLQGDESYSRSSITLSVHPGQQFNITITALGQAGFPVPSELLSEHRYTGDKYRLSPSNQYINGTCTNAYFRLYSAVDDDYVHIKLYTENPCQSLVDGLDLYIAILPCPLGFMLSEDDHKCVCSKKIQKFIQNCFIDNVSFERARNTFWISQTNSSDLIFHNYRCPLDYCNDKSINVSLNHPSIQCDFNRTEILCGQCKKNFSLALGSLHCVQCDNNMVALITVFALAGVVLIAIIFSLRLTVSVGTLNGIFFYTNVIQANHQVFFPRAKTSFLTIFIPWLNLDFGIESCFYDGMDIYAYSWFQFIFPFYVWFLIVLIILVCHYSQSFAKRLGQNPVAVLATLLLMSYSKILSATITPLSWTYLTYYTSSNEYHQVVWLYDGSIGFFKEPKHTILGLFAILSLLLLVFPYIFLLLFGHWLQGCSNWWILSWLNKIKPFMDAYHAPYTKHARYWTGLLLLSRLGLFLTFAINTFGSNSVNILAVSIVTAALLAMKRRVYEHWYMDILESSFILNLCILSVVTFYLYEEFDEHIKSQHTPSTVSIGITFVTFIGILLYHVCFVLKSSSIWKVRMLPFIQKSLLLSTILRITPVKDETTARDRKNTELHALPTSTEIDVDLREPLLESQDAIKV